MENLIYGLIGQTLKHSFSQDYFTNKFKNESIKGAEYRLFELNSIHRFPEIISAININGLNVTIPYKLEIMQYLDELDESARKVGAVNVIKFAGSQLIGFNSDYYGFKKSLILWLGNEIPKSALILGTGGASMAVLAVLNDLKISTQLVSRSKTENSITYQQLSEFDHYLKDCKLIINTTPLGMFPNDTSFPDIPYESIGPQHLLFDLVYNPENTTFMRKGAVKGARTKNGLEMLHFQAEKSWEIWNR